MAGEQIGDMDVEYATTVADRAIRSMSQQSVPSTPRNFSVWFDYAMGTSPALRGINAARSVADEPTSRGELAKRVDRRHGMVRRQRHELFTPADKKRVRDNNQGCGSRLGQCREGRVDFGW